MSLRQFLIIPEWKGEPKKVSPSFEHPHDPPPPLRCLIVLPKLSPLLSSSFLFSLSTFPVPHIPPHLFVYTSFTPNFWHSFFLAAAALFEAAAAADLIAILAINSAFLAMASNLATSFSV